MSTQSNNSETDVIESDPVDGDGVYPFAGLTRFDTEVDVVDLPENVWRQQSSMRYWAGEHADDPDAGPDVLPERGLMTLITELPRATTAEVLWRHPRTGELLETDKHNAVINPETAERIGGEPPKDVLIEVMMDEMGYSRPDLVEHDLDRLGWEETLDRYAPDDVAATIRERVEEASPTGDDALYHIPTSDYTIINPAEFLDPLAEVLDERDFADKVFGEARIDRGGGRCTLDIFVDGQHVESPVFAPDRNPVVVGLEVQWDFFGDWAVRAGGQALDWGCVNRIQRLTDREIVKHRGEVDERQDWHRWWGQILDRIDEKRDQLARLIQAADEQTLDMSALPEDITEQFEHAAAAPWTALYAYMDLPEYLAEHAGKRLRSQATDPYEPTWWEIHSAATYATTHHARGSRIGGGAVEEQARKARDMLFNPPAMEERIVVNYEASVEEGTLAEEGGGIAQIGEAFANVRDKKEQFEAWEQEMRELGVELG